MFEKFRRSFGTLFMLLLLVASLAVAVRASGDHPEYRGWATAGDVDSDHDGIPDLFDFCPGENSLGLPDRDGDGIKDRCDLSPDGDGTLHVAYGKRVFIMDGRPESTLLLASGR